MSFISYLKDNGLLEAKQAQDFTDMAFFAKQDPFHFLMDSQEFAPEGDKKEILVSRLKSWGKSIQIEFDTLTDTQGWVCEEEIYENAGGVNESIVSLMLPIYSEEFKEHMVVLSTPTDEPLLARVQSYYAGVQFVVGVCDKDLWESLYQLHVQPLLVKQMANKMSGTSETGAGLSDTAKNSEARRLYRNLMNVGIERGASDVHFIPCSTEVQVHFRIDGNNVNYTSVPKDVLEKICNILKNDGGVSTRNPREAIDGKVRYSPSGGKDPDDTIDLRVSIIPSKAGPDLNVRYLSSRRYTFEEIGMSPDNIRKYKALLELPSGMVVQVGPTGSGKSTTLYSGLDYIHSSLRNIMTAEDPVEILMDGISQIDVSMEEGSPMKFSDALKAALRHDPDVIVVGELRDEETADLAVRAANTGHLVLTSLHTNDSIGAFERMINLGVEPYSLGEVVAAVMGQRLVRRLCPHCKTPYTLDLSSNKAKYFGLGNGEGTMTLYKAKGCRYCNNTGYRGRVAINEILIVDSTLRNYIQKHEVRKKFEDYLRQQHFHTMYHDGLRKVQEGLTSLEEMKKFAADTIAFKG